ncbi:MAG: hypothetical protein ACJAUD_000578 [Crocinitomicaceae bacterium]|jgi:hypothetical protein
MEDFIYKESDYVKSKDLKIYTDLMLNYDFEPDGIEDEEEFNWVLQYLVSLTKKAPDFLQPYEIILSMLSHFEKDKEVVVLKEETQKQLQEACYRIAEKHDVFNKQIEWGWHENRPLVRGLNFHADTLWKEGEVDKAYELFSKILKTNENDNIGARYSVKATKGGMSHQEFENRFTYSDKRGSYYKNEELSDWFEGV